MEDFIPDHKANTFKNVLAYNSVCSRGWHLLFHLCSCTIAYQFFKKPGKMQMLTSGTAPLAYSGLVKTSSSLTCRYSAMIMELPQKDLFISFKRDVPAHHIIEKHTQRPHSGWQTMVPVVFYPFRWAVYTGAYWNREEQLNPRLEGLHPAFEPKQHYSGSFWPTIKSLWLLFINRVKKNQ